MPTGRLQKHRGTRHPVIYIPLCCILVPNLGPALLCFSSDFIAAISPVVI